MQTDRVTMKNWTFLLSFLFSGLPFVMTSAPYISLDIPQHHFSDSGQQTHTTFITKKYYFVMFFKANFFRAHQYCQYENNLELMTIDSKEEESAFLNLINGKDFEHKTAKHFWTSGTDLAEEGKFFFLSNGKAVGQLNWSQDEPNNARKADSNETENCMAYTMTENLKFYRLFDKFCSSKYYFVCQAISSRKLPPKYRNNL